MKLAILCLCLVGTACAAPFQYLPHFTGSRQQALPSQVRNPFPAGFPHPGVPGAYSVELIYPPSFTGGAGGSSPAQSFPSYGFIKYSIPQPPGRQSVEVFYPYDFARQAIIPFPPMTNGPAVPEALPFEFPPQNSPQQIFNTPSFDANALPSQDPLQPLQQDQAAQTSQIPAKV
ncbi:secretory calcium-binding phosphoprotein 5 [Embiotoca jacksoni]|uniref:secretory calcium-binding phosphoprotein 5 n=1 Tax=Embiotoca jacksoni TaxID=100190 RepID=UPI003704B8CF